MSDTDLELLNRYTRKNAEDAFAQLVRRYLDLVYSAALRQVRSSQLAEEVAQTTFIKLARHARQLAPDTILTAWLYQVTRREAIDVVRREVRRQLREQLATEMNATNATADDWPRIESYLDEAMHTLDETDRAAVLLRYFENKSLREVGQTLGTSEDAAQKRVSRAVERLRAFFVQRGVTIGASGLAVAISANAVQAAPVGLAVTTSSAAVLAAFSMPASAGAASGSFATLFQGWRMKLAAGLVATAFVGISTFMLFRSPPRTGQAAIADSARNIASPSEENRATASSGNQDTNTAVVTREPNPLNLLRAVAQARQRIGSGSIELLLYTERLETSRKENTQKRLVVLFDEPKLRFESFTREYSYKYSADEAEQAEIVKRSDSLDKEASVQAGLLKAFESHHTLACDGTVVLDYWESDEKPGSTTIEDASKWSRGEYFFDPRCLGLRTSLYLGNTVENCLGYNGAKSIALVGEESVEGIPASHVQVQSKYDETLDFWIEIARPTRVLKQATGKDFVLSKYDDANPRDPIPIEVTVMETLRNGPTYRAHFVRSKARFHVPIDPACFSLAGLGMPVGTAVTDIRIHRRIGYWTGTGLAEDPPSQKTSSQSPTPSLGEQMAWVENYPASAEALEAATWILLNTPDGPEVEKAAEVILREHIHDTNLVSLCQQLERLRHRCYKPLLEALLRDNPSADVRGNACFNLAALLKEEAKYGENKPATAAAEKHFERAITEFGQVKLKWNKVADMAKPELDELRRLTLGKPAPEIEGEDLDGQPMKLSTYRGKVVVLTFWWLGYSEAIEHRKLVERMSGKPFAFIGVYSDDDLTKGKAEAEKYGITWPSFRDSRDGPITTTWNVRSRPNIWVLDRQGVIRYRGVRGRELIEAVDTLLRQ